MKVHVVTDLYGTPIEYLLIKANIYDRDVLYEFSGMTTIQILIGDKGYIGIVAELLKK